MVFVSKRKQHSRVVNNPQLPIAIVFGTDVTFLRYRFVSSSTRQSAEWIIDLLVKTNHIFFHVFCMFSFTGEVRLFSFSRKRSNEMRKVLCSYLAAESRDVIFQKSSRKQQFNVTSDHGAAKMSDRQ